VVTGIKFHLFNLDERNGDRQRSRQEWGAHTATLDGFLLLAIPWAGLSDSLGLLISQGSGNKPQRHHMHVLFCTNSSSHGRP